MTSPLKHAALNGRADGDDFIWVDALVGLFAEQLFDDLLDFGHADHAADEHDFVDLGSLEASVFDGLFAGPARLHDQIVDEAFELGARQLHRQVLGTGLIGGDERQVDFGLLGRRQFNLGLFSGFLQTLEGQLVFGQIDALFLFELGCEVVDNALVEVFAAQVGVAVGGFDFEHTVADLEDRDVERAAAEVVDRDRLGLLLLVEAVGECCGGRLVDDAEDFEACYLAGVFGRLTLGVVKVSRDSDDGLIDLLTELGFSGFLHLLKDEGRDLLGRVGLAVAFDPCVAVGTFDDLVRRVLLILFEHGVVEATADEALDGVKRVGRVRHGLTLRGQADETFVVVGEGDDARRGVGAFGVLKHARLGTFHHGNARVCGAKVDADNFSHRTSSFLFGRPLKTRTMAASYEPQKFRHRFCGKTPKFQNRVVRLSRGPLCDNVQRLGI